MYTRILNRFPDHKQFWPVLSTIVFIVFSWTIYRALYQVPSWLYYLTLPRIFPLFAYILSYALLESVLVSVLFLVLCFILPGSWYKNNFTAQSFLLVILLSLAAYLLRSEFDKIQKLNTWQIVGIPLALLVMMVLLIPLLAKILARYPRAAGWLELIANRLTIFGYIYIPFGVLGWLVVFTRNLG